MDDGLPDEEYDLSALESYAAAYRDLGAAEFLQLAPSVRRRFVAAARRRLEEEGVFDVDYRKGQDKIRRLADELTTERRLVEPLRTGLRKRLVVAGPDLAPTRVIDAPDPTGREASTPDPTPDPRPPVSSDLYERLEATTTDIAWLATSAEDEAAGRAVRSSVVAQWRRRDDDFPEPVTAGRSPHFRLDEVHGWLEDTGRLRRQPSAGWLWRQSVHLVPPFADSVGALDLRLFVAGLVAAAIGDPPANGDEVEAGDRGRTRRLIQSATGWAGVQPLKDPKSAGEDLRPVVHALDLAVASTTDHLAILDDALDALGRYSASSNTTSRVLANLIAELALRPAVPGQRVLDPACGEAGLLTTLLSHGLGSTIATADGWDLEDGAIQLAQLRLRFAETAQTTVEVETRDALRPTRQAAASEPYDIVCADPPTKDARRWLRRCLDLLDSHEDARGFVCLSASLLAKGKVADLFGMTRSTDPLPLEAVVFLPRAARRHAAGRQVLCVLTSRDHSPKSCLSIDFSGRKAPRRSADDDRPDELDPASIADLLLAWRRGGESWASRSKRVASWPVAVVHKVESYDKGILPPVPTVPAGIDEALLSLARVLRTTEIPQGSFGWELRELARAMDRAVDKYGLRRDLEAD